LAGVQGAVEEETLDDFLHAVPPEGKTKFDKLAAVLREHMSTRAKAVEQRRSGPAFPHQSSPARDHLPWPGCVVSMPLTPPRSGHGVIVTA
jgi:hypothetical protein